MPHVAGMWYEPRLAERGDSTQNQGMTRALTDVLSCCGVTDFTNRDQRQPMAGNGTGFGARLTHAWLRWQLLHHRELQQRELGEIVSTALERRQPYDASQVSRWFGGRSVPDLRTICEIARALDVDPGWLAFGEDSKAPAPSMVMDPPGGSYAPIKDNSKD